MYRYPYGPKQDRDELSLTVAGFVRGAGGTPRRSMERYRHRGVTEPNGRKQQAEQLKLL
jgi:hypothetical protein